ncbi:uncharacterized protein LOC110824318 isoform X2 [Carica papaya]|uniref:uncharacterized protein LOC110824318 isoform X2 n=1 Tax=Carica papaya TaxID=3649 RepID=UPI000B8CAB0E|nr:uncharacterized protein LOC110824318 isoform X2 [Carica papaya]
MRRSTRKSSVGLGVDEGFNDKFMQVGNFSTRFSLPSFVKRVEKLTDDQRSAIQKVGFGNLLLMPNQMLSKNLLVELMERWSTENQAFMLLPGAITITLMDVALILGLHGFGNPVILSEDEPLSDLERDYGATSLKRKITVASLESRLNSIGEAAVDDFIRTFLLFTVGTLLLPSANGKVDSRYLLLLQNMDDICHFAWGAAVLDDMIMWLNRRKETNVHYVGGCLIFLQVWAYEHVDIARPILLDSYLTFPRACRWGSGRPHQRQWFTSKFKELQDHQITWQLQPTSEELELEVIKELLEQNGTSMVSRQHSSSDGYSMARIIEADSKSNTDSADEREIFRGQEVNLEEQITSKHVPTVQIDTMEHPSMSTVVEANKQVEQPSQCQHSSTDLSNFNEDDLPRNCQLLEVQNVELRKEIDELKNEIRALRSQVLSIPVLEEQNQKLREQVANLIKENQSINLSANNFVARLDAILLDETGNGAEET